MGGGGEATKLKEAVEITILLKTEQSFIFDQTNSYYIIFRWKVSQFNLETNLGQNCKYGLSQSQTKKHAINTNVEKWLEVIELKEKTRITNGFTIFQLLQPVIDKEQKSAPT